MATLDPQERQVAETFRKRLEEALGPRLRGVRVFGSRARGTARPESDLDVLVLLDEADTRSRYRVFQEAHAVMLAFDTFELSPRVMSEKGFQELLERERRLALDIQREGIPI